jgi:16S rRNA (cytidine1402-2'-O)-methyltransferase
VGTTEVSDEVEATSAQGDTADNDHVLKCASIELGRQLARPLTPALYVVATPIGNLGDMTLRAIAALARANIVCAEDTRHSRTLLAHYGIQRRLQPYHEHNADRARPALLDALASGKSIALISDAGTPLVSDPGYKLVRDAVAAGHKVVALPGPSSVLAALAVAGLPTDAFHFAGFLPPKSGARRARLEELKGLQATLVLFEAPSRLASTLADLSELLGLREAAVARELTKLHEELRRGSLSELAQWAATAPPKGEMVILVGPATEAPQISDDDLRRELAQELAVLSLRDATRAVAARTGMPRARVYEIALQLRKAGET